MKNKLFLLSISLLLIFALTSLGIGHFVSNNKNSYEVDGAVITGGIELITTGGIDLNNMLDGAIQGAKIGALTGAAVGGVGALRGFNAAKTPTTQAKGTAGNTGGVHQINRTAINQHSKSNLPRGVHHADDVVRTGQGHHIIGNKAQRELINNPHLSHLRRDDFIVRGLNQSSHNGYQAWHRAADKAMVDFLRTRPNLAQFEGFINKMYSNPSMIERFGRITISL